MADNRPSRFAQGLTTFEAIMVAKTPRPAQKVLIAGLAAMDGEMDWFEEMARNRNLDLSMVPQRREEATHRQIIERCQRK
jgi:hypothetical protein